MNWQRYAELMERRFEACTMRQRFEMFAVDFDNLVYAKGSETPMLEGDCSGTVDGALYLMGYDIRCTADDLYKRLFIDKVTDFLSQTDIMAVFCITKVEREHFGRPVPPGTATHVAPVVGHYVVVNAFNPIDLWPTASVYDYYSQRGFNVDWRKLNMIALQRHHQRRDLFSGIDPELVELRGDT